MMLDLQIEPPCEQHGTPSPVRTGGFNLGLVPIDRFVGSLRLSSGLCGFAIAARKVMTYNKKKGENGTADERNKNQSLKQRDTRNIPREHHDTREVATTQSQGCPLPLCEKSICSKECIWDVLAVSEILKGRINGEEVWH